MSYILEALKKSESERQQAKSPPSIYSPKPAPPVEPERVPKKPRLLLWSALLVFVILMLVVGYQFYGNKMISITITVPEEDTISKNNNPATKVEPDPVPEVETVSEPPASSPDLQTVGKETVAIVENPVEPKSTLAETREAQTAPIEASSSSYVPSLEELDTAFQSTVPDLKLAGHVYSEDASLRMILINDRIVREKNAAAKGFILDEITQNGIILRKGTIRFRIDIP